MTTSSHALLVGLVLGAALTLTAIAIIAAVIVGGRSDRQPPDWPQEGDRLQASGGEEYVFRSGGWQPVGPRRAP